MAGRIDARKETTINGANYLIDAHPATEALAIARRLGAFVEFDTDNPIKAISTLCLNSMKDDPDLKLPLDILRHTQVNKRSMDRALFDDHYAANYAELIAAIKEVVEVNRFLDIAKSFGSLTR